MLQHLSGDFLKIFFEVTKLIVRGIAIRSPGQIPILATVHTSAFHLLNDVIKTLVFPNDPYQSQNGKYVEVVSKFNPIKCTTVLSEMKSNDKPLKSKGGDTCLVHQRKIIGVCQCPLVPIGQCCHRDKSLYVRRVSGKDSEFPAEIYVGQINLLWNVPSRQKHIFRFALNRLHRCYSQIGPSYCKM
ncbi:hypothetical protein ANCCAN_12197 [Ancylostoma caninum]|uniref:Uncharacterized protein n=1 Tax=Ancylostoma caninum TaxID=29170 RepID=A0A368GF34_ANCCA|nr:hypothetical protein ANCCAN_12197 [Ancylostoma caninum]